jgi:hypothetical protein
MELNNLTKKKLNDFLRNAICERNYAEVKKLLESGADPNFQLPEEVYIDCSDYEVPALFTSSFACFYHFRLYDWQ